MICNNIQIHSLKFSLNLYKIIAMQIILYEVTIIKNSKNLSLEYIKLK